MWNILKYCISIYFFDKWLYWNFSLIGYEQSDQLVCLMYNQVSTYCVTSEFREVIILVNDVHDHCACAGQLHFVSFVFRFNQEGIFLGFLEIINKH